MEAQDPLLEWNRLNKANAESAVASAMFSSLLATSPIVDTFSTWLLVGTGATAALFVANVDKVIPFLGSGGFKIAGAVLVASAIFGVLSKVRAVQCQAAHTNGQRILELMQPIFDKHAKDESQISEMAASRGIELNTEFDIAKATGQFSKHFPKWTGWIAARHLKKHQGDPQIGYIIPARFYVSQTFFAALQVVFFILFICASLFFAQGV